MGIVGCGSDISIDTAVHASTTFSECEQLGKSAVKIAREIGWRSSEAFAWQYLGVCQGAQAKYTDALQCIHQSLEIAEGIEHRQWLTAAHRNLGMLYLDLLALPTAQQHFEQAMALAHEIRSMNWIRLVTGKFALALIQQNDLAQAEASLNTFTEIDGNPQTIGLRALWRARAELAMAQGNPDLALKFTDQLMCSAPHVEARGQSSIPLLARLRVSG